MREMALSIRKLTPAIGAELEGIDLSRGVRDEQLAQIRRALMDNLVVFFRDLFLLGRSPLLG